MTWTFDPMHTTISFAARHAMVTLIRGGFDDFAAVVNLNEDDPTKSSVEVTIDAASITTGEKMRDDHLRAADFFDVEKFPKVTFKSTGVEKNGDRYKMVGDLTIRDVTKQVTLDAEYSGVVKGAYGEDRFGFGATADLRRQDFGLEWNAPLPTGGFLVGDTIRIEIDGAGVQQQ